MTAHLAFHYFIYLNLITGFLSALYMVFVVFKVDKGVGPLWKLAKSMDSETFLKRRLYALECWIIFGFLAVYFALTDGASLFH